MTNDLVNRLRDDGKLGYPPWHQPCIEIMREAADEIERLRADLAACEANENARGVNDGR